MQDMGEPVVCIGTQPLPSASALALQDSSLTVEQGSVSLMGATGAGKTTLCLALIRIVPQFFGGELAAPSE
jgi:ABC-type multidrug transport system ATPase subunit